MKIPQAVSAILREHVTLEVESLDRVYLNVYVPQVQYDGGVVAFLHQQRAAKIASTALVGPMTEAFVAAIKGFAKGHNIPLVSFRKGQRKDDIAQVPARPVQGRLLFEQIIPEHLDLGRPDHVQLIFARRISGRTPSRFRTWVITEGVPPALPVDDKHARIKQ